MEYRIKISDTGNTILEEEEVFKEFIQLLCHLINGHTHYLAIWEEH